jgi:hypothetical protein
MALFFGGVGVMVLAIVVLALVATGFFAYTSGYFAAARHSVADYPPEAWLHSVDRACVDRAEEYRMARNKDIKPARRRPHDSVRRQ